MLPIWSEGGATGNKTIEWESLRKNVLAVKAVKHQNTSLWKLWNYFWDILHFAFKQDRFSLVWDNWGEIKMRNMGKRISQDFSSILWFYDPCIFICITFSNVLVLQCAFFALYFRLMKFQFLSYSQLWKFIVWFFHPLRLLKTVVLPHCSSFLFQLFIFSFCWFFHFSVFCSLSCKDLLRACGGFA